MANYICISNYLKLKVDESIYALASSFSPILIHYMITVTNYHEGIAADVTKFLNANKQDYVILATKDYFTYKNLTSNIINNIAPGALIYARASLCGVDTVAKIQYRADERTKTAIVIYAAVDSAVEDLISRVKAELDACSDE